MLTFKTYKQRLFKDSTSACLSQSELLPIFKTTAIPKDFHAPLPRSLHRILRPQRTHFGAKTRRFYAVFFGARDAGLHGNKRMAHGAYANSRSVCLSCP